jgi:hypothetical protein
MKESARWMLTVSSDVDRRARRYLASANRKGDLSAFVEEAVRSKLLQLSMRKECGLGRPIMPSRAEDVEADRILSAAYARPSAKDVEPEDAKPALVTPVGEGRYGG